MATLVPNFNLPLGRSEIVFLCDRSWSMSTGNRMPNLITALHIFHKSLPIGIKLNVCNFGSQSPFLWQRPKTYDQTSLGDATHHSLAFQLI